MEGYKQTLTNNDISYDRELVVELTDHVDLPREINRLMALREPPTSLFCTTHRGTLLVANCLQRLQLRIPEDISVVGFGDYEVSPLMNPPLTTIHQPIYDMGKMAASVMEELTKQQKYSKIQKMLPTQLKIRKSTRILR
jgi:LacI family transcriptional regulator